jgi:hypothetical protein
MKIIEIDRFHLGLALDSVLFALQALMRAQWSFGSIHLQGMPYCVLAIRKTVGLR